MKLPIDRDTRSKDEIQRQKDVAREERSRADTETLLKQMLGLEGSRGQDENFRLRHTFTFWPEERLISTDSTSPSGLRPTVSWSDP